MGRLDGQVAIITGGARGIGEGICEVFCNEGATVALWDVLEIGDSTANRISSKGGAIFFQKVNITSKKEVEEAVKEIIIKYKKIDILINNAGVIRDRSFMKMSQQEWDTVININLNSLYTTTKAVLPYMKESGYGRIISASSINGYQGAFGQVNYAATKAGVSGFTRALCKEVGRYGITVNAVAPGFIKSPMTEDLSEDQKNSIMDKIPMKKFGLPEDVANLALFLTSDYSSYITGQSFHVNGGMLML